ncbi:MAG: alpha/beta hydrolase [Alphaproteobacteria bacterium]|nr:MAG: alpha/beta hydrolase [Alphaproteobacteria bacterium]
MHRRDFFKLAGYTAAATAAASVLPLAAFATASPAAAPMTAASFHAARRFVPTRFGRIAYLDRGQGDVALFLHGFPLNGFQWRGAIDILSAQRRCIAPDFMGLGYTEVASEEQDITPAAQAAMLDAFLTRLGIDTVDVIASDSGGAIAQIFMVTYPHRVKSLLLTNCDTELNCPPEAMMPVIEMAHAGVWADRWLGAWRADKALARSSEGIGGMCYTDPAHPTDEAIDTYFTPLTATPEGKGWAHAYVMALEKNALAGISGKLKASKVPTRIVWGRADAIFASSDAEHLDRTVGNSKGIRWLEGSKLFWPEERPDVVAEEALRLWHSA